MSKSKELAAEWQRISRAKADIRDALAEHGIAIPRESKIDEFAPAIRGYTPASVSIYKRGMFERSPQSRLPNLSVSPTYSPADMASTFANCKDLRSIPVVDGLEKATSIMYYAYGCSLASGRVILPSLPNCTSMVSAFDGCYSIERLEIGDAPECTDMRNIANSCRLVTGVKIGAINKVVYMDQAFIGCSSLETIEISVGSSLVGAGRAFGACRALRSIVGTIDFSSVDDTGIAFDDCYNLEEVRIKGLKADLNMQWSQKLSLESVKYLVDNLQQVSGKTITLAVAWKTAHADEAKQYAKTAALKGFSLSFR